MLSAEQIQANLEKFYAINLFLSFYFNFLFFRPYKGRYFILYREVMNFFFEKQLLRFK